MYSMACYSDCETIADLRGSYSHCTQDKRTQVEIATLLKNRF